MPDIDTSATTAPDDPLRPREFAQWIADVEQDQELLRRLVKHLKKTELGQQCLSEQTLNDIAGEGCGPGYSKSRYDNWLNRKVLYDTSELTRVLRYLVRMFREIEHGPGSGTHEDPDRLVDVVSRLNDYLSVSPRNREGLKTRFEGYYWVFRPSVTAPGRYIRGLLGMRWVAEVTRSKTASVNGMIRTCEVHQHRGEMNHGMPVLFESYDGFALVKSGILFAFMAERFADHDRGPLLITRIHSFLPADRRQPLQMAWGRTIGASNLAHALPIVLVKITDDQLRSTSGVTGSPSDLELLWAQTRENSNGKQPPIYLSNLLERCGIVDPGDKNGLPPTVLAQINSLNREAWLFSEQFRRDPN